MRYLLVLLITGCALSPAELRETGERSTHTVQLQARNAAYCMANNAEAFRPAFSDPLNAFVREPQPGLYEVLVQGALNNNFALARVQETSVTIWLSPMYLAGAELLSAMLAGC